MTMRMTTLTILMMMMMKAMMLMMALGPVNAELSCDINTLSNRTRECSRARRAERLLGGEKKLDKWAGSSGGLARAAAQVLCQ